MDLVQMRLGGSSSAGSGVVAIVRELEPAGMAQHVGMDREWHLGGLPTRWMRRWKPMGLIGPPRDQPEDRESSRARGAADTARRADELIE
jgi:hypothetical protein